MRDALMPVGYLSCLSAMLMPCPLSCMGSKAVHGQGTWGGALSDLRPLCRSMAEGESRETFTQSKTFTQRVNVCGGENSEAEAAARCSADLRGLAVVGEASYDRMRSGTSARGEAWSYATASLPHLVRNHYSSSRPETRTMHLNASCLVLFCPGRDFEAPNVDQGR